jgi:hypothetical protein
MNLVHPWNLIMIIYAVGIVFSLQYLVNRDTNPRAAMIFYLAVLGVGIFSWYQGRSHNYALPTVWYPALIILIVFTDNLWAKISRVSRTKKTLIVHYVLFIGLFYLFTSGFISTFANSSFLFNKRIYPRYINKTTRVLRNINYIKQNVAQEKEVLFLSFQNPAFSLETKTLSPLNIPGLAEIFLRKDFNKINQFISQGKPKKIFFDTLFLVHNYELYLELLNSASRYYEINSASPDKNIILFSRTKPNKEKRRLLPPNNDINIVDYKIENKIIFDDIAKKYVGLSGYYTKPIKLNKRFSVEIIVKPANEQVLNSHILGNHPGDAPGYRGFVIQQDQSNNNAFNFGFGNSREWSPGVQFKLKSLTWHYVSIFVDRNKVKVFDNGSLVADQNVKVTLANSTMPLYVGDWYLKDRPFNGEIREIRISNGSLSLQELTRNWLIVKKKLLGWTKR